VQARSRYEIAARRLESLQKVDKETQAQAAQAQLEAARGRRKAAEAQLAYSRITSPIDGVVTDRPLYAGEMAGPGTLLMTVMNLSRIIARASVPAHQLRFIKAGNSAVIRSPDGSVRVQGKVTVVSPALNPASTTAEIWVLAENSGRRLKPGYAVHVYISSERIPDAIVIPASALQPAQKGAGDSVLVVGPDSLAHVRSVDIGIRESDHVQVLRGVNPGEQVITVGGFGLRDNAKVKIINPDGKKTEQQ
jgi:HlyD family secretion protein